jgi:hypothetical protein
MKYANPYLAGVGVGLVLIATFVLTGHGLGAVGAYERVVHTNHETWTLYEMLGVALGGALSAGLSGRLRLAIARGPHATPVTRVATAAAGGVAMGVGAKLAHGCTSGLALSGGAVLSVGAWVFIACAFAAGYAIMLVAKRLWI